MFKGGIVRFFISLFLMFTFISCTGSNQEVLTKNQLQELQTYYQKKQYFDLQDALQQYRHESSVMLSFFRGMSDNKFNQLNRSIRCLKTFIGKWKEKKNDNLLIDAYKTLGDCYSKTFQYKKAVDIYRKIQGKFKDQLDTEQLNDIKNYIRIFNALKDVSPQTAEIHQKTSIQFVDGGYIPMRINDVDMELGLDTGANYSFIMRSLAEKVHMQIIDANFDVHNVAGQIVKADVGVASKMEIGHTVLRNIVFLVFEDKDLYFPKAKYQIRGCIGFPVIASLREVTFHKMNSLTIHKTLNPFIDQNLCLDDLTPVIAGYYRGHRFAFCLDTGAGKSVLYPPFFKAFKEEIMKKLPLQSERTQGLGGFREIPAYVMKEAAISFAGKKAIFQNLPILTDFTNDSSRYFFGNIGRDLLNQFKTMTLNFESMFVKFE